MAVPRLRVVSVSKQYPGVRALHEVSVEVLPGTVHGLCGENGAGKSTLMKIIAGVETPDSGDMLLNDQPLKGIDEQGAGLMGIGMVHQERSLIPGLSVAENVFVGRQPTGRFGGIDYRMMRERTWAILKELDAEIDPRMLVSDTSPGEAQMVEIAKALSVQLRLLILDEPTAALSIKETEHLFSVIRHLTAQGISVIYISHRLEEIFEICDDVTVLKDGQVTGTGRTSDVTRDQIIRWMVGREVVFERVASLRQRGKPILELQSIRADPFVRDASLTIHEGEIVCLAGLIGAGRSELCETVFGVRKKRAGTIRFDGREVEIGHSAEAVALGIAMVPEDRKTDGLFTQMNIAQNFLANNLDLFSKRGIVSDRTLLGVARQFMEVLTVSTQDPFVIVNDLSGGNQQKVLLGKWFARHPKLLIVDEPTRGVDVGARAEIYRILRQLRDQGVALLVVSSDLPEVLTLADRIVVMAEGFTVGELDGDGAGELEILQLAALSRAKEALG